MVVGILERRGKLLGLFNMDNVVVLPMSTFLEQFGKRRSVSLNVQARSPEGSSARRKRSSACCGSAAA